MSNCFSLRSVLLALVSSAGVFLLSAEPAGAQAWEDGGGQWGGGSPVYQQNAFDGKHRDDRRDWRKSRRDTQFVTPAISSGTFQRPYPYHLDYYKMRYGGSYAPYFGNLYGTPFGTPQVVNYPPYYGPYYTGYGNGNNNGMQPGNGPAMEYPADAAPGATESNGPAMRTNGESLPAPRQ